MAPAAPRQESLVENFEKKRQVEESPEKVRGLGPQSPPDSFVVNRFWSNSTSSVIRVHRVKVGISQQEILMLN